MAPTVRLATTADIALLVQLVGAMHREGALPMDEHSERALRALLAEPRLGFALVAQGPDGSLVGYLVVGVGFSIEFRGRDAFVDELYVVPGQRGRGVGTALLVAAEAHAGREGIAALHLEVDHDNQRARGLYRRLGYQEHPRHLMTKWTLAGPPGPDPRAPTSPTRGSPPPA
jgi:ribosomal protein S18 acetylase RimI-like enzyme